MQKVFVNHAEVPRRVARVPRRVARVLPVVLVLNQWATGPVGPLKGIPRAYRKPIGAMVTGRGYGYRPGPEITRGYISGRPGPKYYFPNQFFALIPNFLSGRSYLSGNQCFIKSSSKIDENLNLNSHGPSEQKKICSFFHIFYTFSMFFRFVHIFTIFLYKTFIWTYNSTLRPCPFNRKLNFDFFCLIPIFLSHGKRCFMSVQLF